MARSDLLLSIVRAGAIGDQSLFRRSLEALVAEERAKQHQVLASQLSEYLQPTNGAAHAGTSLSGTKYGDSRGTAGVTEIVPQRSLDQLILPEGVAAAIREVVEEQQRADLLRSQALEPRNRILLVGPPGNGKTSLAEAIAGALLVPLLVVRYESVIGSYLGETATRLQRVFDHARTRQCVLFFDEFDTLSKERGDAQDTGEVKRVVSSLLLQIDALPSYVVVVAASNHQELFDRAVWRRFQLRLHLPAPTRAQVGEWFQRFEQRLGETMRPAPRALAERLVGLSFAEVEEFTNDVLRRRALSEPAADLARIVADRLKQWQKRAKLASRKR